MIFPIKGLWRLVGIFDEPRPISNPGKHKHGAIDISTLIGTPFYAPEDGKLYAQYMIRMNENSSQNIKWPDGSSYAFRNYYQDIFGGVTILEGESGFTHVFCHSYLNQIFNKGVIPKNNFKTIENVAYNGNLIFNIISHERPVVVKEGDLIGYSGNAGASIGAHLHYEIHMEKEWTSWAKRPNPEKIFPEIMNSHRSEYEKVVREINRVD